MHKIYLIIFFLILCYSTVFAQEEIFLWKNSDSINNIADYPFEHYKEQNYLHPKRHVQMAKFVTNPSIRVFLSDPKINTGAAIIINPGGGMNVIELEHEGITIAKAFANLGINAFVLKYRHYSMDVAKKDALKAIDLVRSKASEWNINENAIGMGGFSAGGSLSLLTTFDLLERSENSKIPINFLMLVYTRTHLYNRSQLPNGFPPTFQLVTADDFRFEMNLDFYKTLQENKIPSELHIFQQGKHGFGIGKGLCNCENWPDLFFNWLGNNKLTQNDKR